MRNASGVFIGQRPDGKVEIVGRGLPVRLDDEQAKDVIGGICAVKNWIVLPGTDPDGNEIVRVHPRDDSIICSLTAIREVVDEYARQVRDPASVRGAVAIKLTDLVHALVNHALRAHRDQSPKSNDGAQATFIP